MKTSVRVATKRQSTHVPEWYGGNTAAAAAVAFAAAATFRAFAAATFRAFAAAASAVAASADKSTMNMYSNGTVAATSPP